MNIHKTTSSNYRSSIQTLGKILKNIVENPKDEKFRVLKHSNEKLRSLIFESDVIPLILEMCGFEEAEFSDTKVFILKPENDRFSLYRMILKEIEDRAPE